MTGNIWRFPSPTFRPGDLSVGFKGEEIFLNPTVFALRLMAPSIIGSRGSSPDSSV